MLYQDSFWLKGNNWNNSFDYNKRLMKNINPAIYVPKLIQWDINDIKIWNNPVLQFVWNDGELVNYIGLKNFVKIKYKTKTIYIIDNHNHALFFWYLEISRWKINKDITVLHIDQHSDMKPCSDFQSVFNLENVFEYTNYELNVWNYLFAAHRCWIVNDIIQIRTQDKLSQISNNEFDPTNTILNIDMDFWHPDMINDLEKDILVQKLIKQIDLITIATSPYFIDQDIAIKKVKTLLS